MENKGKIILKYKLKIYKTEKSDSPSFCPTTPFTNKHMASKMESL